MAALCPLESMPYELKVAILHNLPDVQTLSSLIHASPAYHAVYTGDREALLTSSTLRDLQGRDINIFKDELITQVQVRERDRPNICLGTSSPTLIKSAVLAARDQHRSRKAVKLQVYQCVALLSIIRWIDFRYDTNSNGTKKGWCSNFPYRMNFPLGDTKWFSIGFGSFSDREAEEAVEHILAMHTAFLAESFRLATHRADMARMETFRSSAVERAGGSSSGGTTNGWTVEGVAGSPSGRTTNGWIF